MMDSFRTSAEQKLKMRMKMKIHLPVKTKFISSKDDVESQPMHSRSNNIENNISNDADEITA